MWAASVALAARAAAILVTSAVTASPRCVATGKLRQCAEKSASFRTKAMCMSRIGLHADEGGAENSICCMRPPCSAV
eukprot:3306935-Prymnesium_polylepis.2